MYDVVYTFHKLRANWFTSMDVRKIALTPFLTHLGYHNLDFISMSSSQTVIDTDSLAQTMLTPLLMQYGYCSFALSNRNV